MLKTESRPPEGPAPLTRTDITIDVTPLFKQGNEVVCAIDPPPGYASGGNIKLSKSGSYTLEFRLLAGTPAKLKFRPDQAGACKAFWSDAADCPTHDMNDQYYRNARLDDPTTLKVDVDPPGADYAVHYRLNFDNNGHFDPIIINQ